LGLDITLDLDLSSPSAMKFLGLEKAGVNDRIAILDN
jgi:hypothetical protein